ncbi:CBS sensor hybrid histidine kinase [Thalassoporum mexicanum PCC 7367]|uniref:hybrid sensor histidine kinase/response regulator n=1 Tax=Thalassoporum mexicanum TaxID=3457544 RepID=UPI00029F9C88|nr:hybrid sensor histidine kinase/response regulator [Pseudanabaena sp. PCC 7367]AFY69000.1 CBS sensor hybrid histidine kinase [Pseudanabaena sp. PCC 7367]
MESCDSTQALALFAQSNVATCSLDASALSAFYLLRRGWSYVVVLDQSNRPQGLFTAASILGWLDMREEGWSIYAHRSLRHCDLLPLPTIAHDTTIATFLKHINAHPSYLGLWALLDAGKQYSGIIETLPLLRQLATTKSDPNSFSELLQLVAQFPLPIMVCNAQAESLATNQAWRTAIPPNSFNYADYFPSQSQSAQSAQSVGLNAEPPHHAHMAVNQASHHLDQANQANQVNPDLEAFGAQADRPMVKNLRVALDPEPPLPFSHPNTHTHSNGVNGADEGAAEGIALSLNQPELLVHSGHLVGSLSNYHEGTWQFSRVKLPNSLPGLELIIATDISQQEQLAEKLAQQNTELVKLTKLKDEFLACISHELKTPLTSIIGISSMLANKNIGELSDRQSRYLSMIHQSGRHLMQIIDRMVDLAKAETGQLELNFEPVAIAQLCEHTIEQTYKLLTQEALERGLDKVHLPTIKLEIDLNLETIVADGYRLQQMLLSLLSNAFKFNQVEPEQAKLGLTVNHWDGWIAFTVWDHGIGIPEDKQHLIFQKFQQLENTLTRQFEGTGLGLVLTRTIARLHGGDVTFVSKVNEGSQFTVLLPPVPPHLLEETNSKISVATNRLVLIVDHDANDIKQTIEVITVWGYRAVVARSGTEALEKARRLQPHLILLNPELPTLSGWDALALLKQDPATREIKTIVLAGASVREKRHHQANGFLHKPLQTSSLNSFLSDQIAEPEVFVVLCLGHSLEDQIADQLRTDGHRLLEVGSLDQGDILVKIWHPDLVLLNVDQDELEEWLAQIDDSYLLLNLPILLTVPQMESMRLGQMRQQFPDLSLFGFTEDLGYESNGLSRAIANAVGHLHSPTILMAELGNPITTTSASLPASSSTASLHQYLRLAGFQIHLLDLIGNDHHRSLSQQLQTMGIDALLVCIQDLDNLTEQHHQTIEIIAQAQSHPPIIVIDGRSDPSAAIAHEGLGQLINMATAVVNQAEAIAKIVPTLQQCLLHK